MNRAVTILANVSWFLSSVPGYLRFRRALRSPEAFQSALLGEFLRDHRDTEMGRQSGFDGITGWDDFRTLPLTSGADYRPAIERIMRGHEGVLTRDAVKVLQPTSGTSSAPKLIPFTEGVGKQFCAALDAWISDLFLRHPRLFLGPQYWSISPAAAVGGSVPESSVPVGFLDDAEYFGSGRRGMMRHILAVPPEVGKIPHMEASQYVTGLFLLREKHLGLISVWHPSFLTILLLTLRSRWDQCLEDLAKGGIRAEIELPPGIRGRLVRRLMPMPAREAELRSLDPEGDDLWGRVWPDLAVISCWRGGEAESEVSELETAFPAACIQGKGLLATEGVVSIPFGGSTVCAVTSHVLEFEDAQGRIRGVWELEAGRQYSIILTTCAGLCRYSLKDRVEVTGFRGRTPCIRFLGRSGIVSDLVGEKLHIEHVEDILSHLARRYFPRHRLAVLVPSKGAKARRYSLLVEKGEDETFDPSAVAIDIESGLCENYHYAYARQLGQLEPAEVIPVDSGFRARFRDFMAGRGGIAATVKYPALCNISGIEDWVGGGGPCPRDEG
jgi:hypothetical protein